MIFQIQQGCRCSCQIWNGSCQSFWLLSTADSKLKMQTFVALKLNYFEIARLAHSFVLLLSCISNEFKSLIGHFLAPMIESKIQIFVQFEFIVYNCSFLILLIGTPVPNSKFQNLNSRIWGFSVHFHWCSTLATKYTASKMKTSCTISKFELQRVHCTASPFECFAAKVLKYSHYAQAKQNRWKEAKFKLCNKIFSHTVKSLAAWKN